MAKVILDNNGDITALLINPVSSIAGVITIADDDPRIAAFEAVHPTIIPNVTKRQMLLWLYQNLNKTDADVQTAIQSIPDVAAREIAMIEWLYPDSAFARSNPLFDQLAPIMGMTIEQVDVAFVAASTL
jgi:hypothetical protein